MRVLVQVPRGGVLLQLTAIAIERQMLSLISQVTSAYTARGTPIEQRLLQDPDESPWCYDFQLTRQPLLLPSDIASTKLLQSECTAVRCRQ